jgi:hypothetical protein
MTTPTHAVASWTYEFSVKGLKLDKRNGILSSQPYNLPLRPAESHTVEACSEPVRVLYCVGSLNSCFRPRYYVAAAGYSVCCAA